MRKPLQHYSVSPGSTSKRILAQLKQGSSLSQMSSGMMIEGQSLNSVRTRTHKGPELGKEAIARHPDLDLGPDIRAIVMRVTAKAAVVEAGSKAAGVVAVAATGGAGAVDAVAAGAVVKTERQQHPVTLNRQLRQPQLQLLLATKLKVKSRDTEISPAFLRQGNLVLQQKSFILGMSRLRVSP